MVTKPEQLAKWREDAEYIWVREPSFEGDGWPTDCFVAGYVRAMQKNEQAVKDARKQALEDAYAIYDAIYEQAQELSHVKDGLRELLK